MCVCVCARTHCSCHMDRYGSLHEDILHTHLCDTLAHTCGSHMAVAGHTPAQVTHRRLYYKHEIGDCTFKMWEVKGHLVTVPHRTGTLTLCLLPATHTLLHAHSRTWLTLTCERRELPVCPTDVRERGQGVLPVTQMYVQVWILCVLPMWQMCVGLWETDGAGLCETDGAWYLQDRCV